MCESLLLRTFLLGASPRTHANTRAVMISTRVLTRSASTRVLARESGAPILSESPRWAAGGGQQAGAAAQLGSRRSPARYHACTIAPHQSGIPPLTAHSRNVGLQGGCTSLCAYYRNKLMHLNSKRMIRQIELITQAWHTSATRVQDIPDSRCLNPWCLPLFVIVCPISSRK